MRSLKSISSWYIRSWQTEQDKDNIIFMEFLIYKLYEIQNELRAQKYEPMIRKRKLSKIISYFFISGIRSLSQMNISEHCHICKQSSDQILMLSCIHDVCTHCAASSYAQQVHIKGLNSKNYICEICQTPTQLDETSVTELNNLSRQFIKTTSHRNINNHKHLDASRNKPRQSYSPSKRIIYYCRVHGQEEISYFCFGCNQTICPQCAIHGAHKDHEVKLIKKAISQVKNQFLQIMHKVNESQGRMSKYKDNFIKSIKQSQQRYEREKLIVAKEFQRLRNALAVKEREVLEMLEKMNRKNIETLKSFLEDLNINYEEINKVKKSVELVLRKDQVLIFQDYPKIPDFDQKTAFIIKQSESINGQIKILNTEFFNQEGNKINDCIKQTTIQSRNQQMKPDSNYSSGGSNKVKMK